MTKLSLSLLTMMICVGASATAGVVPSPVKQIFVPTGFDNNDNVEVIVRGIFPNSCLSRNSYEVKVQGDKIRILITALETKKTETCERVSIPFLEDITIGTLQAGNYTVVVNDQLQESLQVAESSSSSVDDHLYAMVDYVDLGFTGGLGGQVYLVGKTMNCLDLDRIEVISNGNDTLSVLPIMKIGRSPCSERRIPFNVPLNFSLRNLPAEKVLLFVRTMDGKSIHSLIER